MKNLIYNKPAENWKEAIPVGNGRLGAKIYGCPEHEIIKLNEESIWSGAFQNRANKSAQKNLKNIKELVRLRRESEAQELVFEALTSTPETMNYYESAGELHIDFYDSEHYGLEGKEINSRNAYNLINTYKRELNLETGVHVTNFSTETNLPSTADLSLNTLGSSIIYTWETFVSEYSDVIVMRFTSSVPKGIYFRARFERNNVNRKFALSDDTIVMQDFHGIPFAAMVTADSSGGKISVRGDNLIVEGADDVILYLDIETAYRLKRYQAVCGNVNFRPQYFADYCTELALKKICFASGTSYENLLKKHIEDYSLLFGKTQLHTDFEQGEFFWTLSKYLSLCSSQTPGTLMPLKNGLWYDGTEPKEERMYIPYSKKIAEYFYESFNFGDKKTRFKFIKRLYKHAKKCADDMYGTDGIVIHGSTDIWGDSCPSGIDFKETYKNLGAVYISDFIISNYEHTQDIKFLKKTWKIIYKAAVFFDQNLTLVDDGKRLSLNPAFENGICEESVYTNAVIKHLYENALKAAKYLNISETDERVLNLKNHISLLGNLSYQAESDFKIPETAEEVNVFDYVELNDKIVKTEIVDNRVKICLLSDVPKEWKTGSLLNYQIKGNLTLDVEWNEGKIKSAKIRRPLGKRYINLIKICYDGKTYDSAIVDDSLDLLNVLPSTVVE